MLNAQHRVSTSLMPRYSIAGLMHACPSLPSYGDTFKKVREKGERAKAFRLVALEKVLDNWCCDTMRFGGEAEKFRK
jgi:hypothetical protein